MDRNEAEKIIEEKENGTHDGMVFFEQRFQCRVEIQCLHYSLDIARVLVDGHERWVNLKLLDDF